MKKHDIIVIDQGIAYYRCGSGDIQPESIAIGDEEVSCKTCLKIIAKHDGTKYQPLEQYGS